MRLAPLVVILGGSSSMTFLTGIIVWYRDAKIGKRNVILVTEVTGESSVVVTTKRLLRNRSGR